MYSTGCVFLLVLFHIPSVANLAVTLTNLSDIPILPLLRENRKRHVLLLNAFTYQSEYLSDFRADTQRINRIYAEKWGYWYEARYMSFDNSTIPPPWQRIKDTLDILDGDFFEYVFYLDLDAAVANHSISVENVVNVQGKRADLIVGRERRGTDKEKRRVRTYYHYANPGCPKLKQSFLLQLQCRN